MKVYSSASIDLETAIESMVREYHPDLAQVRIAALFMFDDENSDPVLMHNGYPAGAVVRITTLRERALGMADAVIVVDRAYWQTITHMQHCALIDHELTHLGRKLDSDTQQPIFDALGRPKLQMRRHDHQLGWFDEVAQRHGENSIEMRQARDLVQSTYQLYFEFGPPKPPEPEPVEESRVNLRMIQDELGQLDIHISLGALQSRSAEDILACTLWLEATEKLGARATQLGRPEWLPVHDEEGATS
jgi:putative metallopeptidase